MPKKAGSVPFQIVDGSVHVCLVSSKKRKDKFVLPKGVVRSSETDYDAAKRETFEEAGLRGIMSQKGIDFKTSSADLDHKQKMIKYFPMYTDEIFDDWPEQKSRERLWIDINDMPESKIRKRDIAVLKSKLINSIIETLRIEFAA